MWPYALGALGIGVLVFLFEKAKGPVAPAQHLPGIVPSIPSGPSVTPGGQAPPTFPIPAPTSFVTRVLPGGLGPVAAFQLDTQKAMVQALSAREWRIYSLLSTEVMLIGPPNLVIAANSDVLSAIRMAATAGMNVFMDADMALKLAGSGADPSLSSNMIAISMGIPKADPTIANEAVALTPEHASASLDASIPMFVLFAQAGENF